MRRFVILITSLSFIAVLITVAAPYSSVSAASVGTGKCVKTKNHDCKKPTSPTDPSSPASPAPAAGLDTTAAKDACSGLDQLGGTSCGSGESVIGTVANRVVNIISMIAGIAAVIMIIISGLKYVTSGGDATKVGSAKTTLLYALVGIVIAALAQFLVHYVLNKTNVSQ